MKSSRTEMGSYLGRGDFFCLMCFFKRYGPSHAIFKFCFYIWGTILNAQTMLGLGKRKDEASRLDSSHFIYEKCPVPCKNRSETKKACGIWTQAAQTECRRSTACATTTAFPRKLTCKTTVWLTTHKMKKRHMEWKNVKNGFTTKHFLLKMHRPKNFWVATWDEKKIQKEEEEPRYFGNSLWSGRPSNWSRSRNKWTLLFQGLLETKTFQTRLATVHWERCWAVSELRRLQ